MSILRTARQMRLHSEEAASREAFFIGLSNDVSALTKTTHECDTGCPTLPSDPPRSVCLYYTNLIIILLYCVCVLLSSSPHARYLVQLVFPVTSQLSQLLSPLMQ